MADDAKGATQPAMPTEELRDDPRLAALPETRATGLTEAEAARRHAAGLGNHARVGTGRTYAEILRENHSTRSTCCSSGSRSCWRCSACMATRPSPSCSCWSTLSLACTRRRAPSRPSIG